MGKIGKIALLAIGAILLSWMIIKLSVSNGLTRSDPTTAHRIAPGNPEATLSLAMHDFAASNLKIKPATLAMANAALRRAPLSEEPFLLAGVAALSSGEHEMSRHLLEEARRRNPRSRPARLFLLDRYLRDVRIQEATREIAVLTRLIPETNKVLIPELARLASNPATIDTLARALDTDDRLQQSVLMHLASIGADANIVLRLAGSKAFNKHSEANAPWRSKLLENLITKGEVNRAHGIWTRFAGIGQPDAIRIYDPQFEGMVGPPPFNWSFVASANGVAEPSAHGGLDVQYYGRATVDLARQLIILPPGRYRLSFRATGNSPQTGSGLAWRIMCYSGKGNLVEIPFGKLDYSGTTITSAFTVPPQKCPAQWLSLTGAARDLPTPESITISRLHLSELG